MQTFSANPQTTRKLSKTKRSTSESGILGIPVGAKLPPHSEEAERQTIGAMMLDRQAIARVVEILEPDCFYNNINRTIFEAILSMFERGIQVDFVTLAEELRSRGQIEFIGGTYYLTELNSKTPSTANVAQHALIIKEKYLKRSLISAAASILENAYDETVDALEEIDKAESQIFAIAEKRFQKSYVGIKKLAMDAYNLIEKLSERDSSGLTGVRSGFVELDKLTGGFQNSDLVIIAGRPSMGKTALGLSIARNVAVEYKAPVAFFSIEMAAVQLVIRLISAEAKIDQHKLRTGKINADDNRKIVQSLGRLAEAPLFIDDSPMMSIMELRAKCRRLKAEHQIKLIMVDYLQLIHSTAAESREREISMISQSLKQIAKELEIPVIALAQLNRSVEGRSDKRPMLSDLRESGSIEQDADVVMFVNRPEVYKKMQYEDGSPTEGTAELIIGKQRNGPIDTVKVAFVNKYARFENLAYGYEEQPENVHQIQEYDDDGPGF